MDKTILLAVLFGSLAHGPLAAQTGSVSGSGSAAAVATTVSTQQFASAALPSAGGMTDSELASIAVLSTVSADGLASITTGQLDEALVSATTTAQAANVNVLNGLIRRMRSWRWRPATRTASPRPANRTARRWWAW